MREQEDFSAYYGKIKEFRYKNDLTMRRMGIEIVEMKPGWARQEMPYIEELHANSIGGVHGGILFTLADSVGATAAATRGNLVTTSDGTIHFLNAAIRPEKLIGIASELKCGRRLLVYDVRILDDKGKLIAQATMEYARLKTGVDEI